MPFPTIDDSRHDLTHADLDLIRTALHMAAHEYLATIRDLGGIGAEADRCAKQRNRISKLLPRIEQRLQAAQNAELIARAEG